MNALEIIQIILFFGIGIALTPPLGKFMASVFKGERTFLHPVVQPIENAVYRLTGSTRRRRCRGCGICGR